MRLEPEERRNYVLSQLDEYGRVYVACLETFVYRLWSRQRVLLKNCKLYEEKLMTISEVIGSLTGRDTVVENNNAESAKLERNLKEIHSVVFIPPIKSNDVLLLNKLLVTEDEESLDFMALALNPSGSRLLSPLGLAPHMERSARGRHHSVIKSQSSSSSPSPSSHASVERMDRESNNANVRESATSFVRVNGSSRGSQGSAVITSSHNSPPNSTTSNSNSNNSNNNNNHNNNISRRSEADLKVSTTSNNATSNGHVSVISSSVSNRSVGRPSRSTNECLDSASAIAAVTAAFNNNIETSSSTSSNQSTSNQSNNSNDRGANGNGIVVKKEPESGYTSRRNGSGKRSNGSIGGSTPKKSRNNRTKDDKEIVKCCAQKGCEYIERDNANNMRKHYRNWHDNIEYPPAPYVKKEMTTETVNQFLHNWMVQRKKKQPRVPRNESRTQEGWPAAMTIDGMYLYPDESDTGHEDEDYEINEHLLTPFDKAPPKAIEMSSKRSS